MATIFWQSNWADVSLPLPLRTANSTHRVKILNTAFEDWPIEEQAFDLAVVADSFHWIPPEIGYPKVARALKPSGSAAFFWNAPVESKTDLSHEIAEVYAARGLQADNPETRFTAG